MRNKKLPANTEISTPNIRKANFALLRARQGATRKERRLVGCTELKEFVTDDYVP